MTCQLDPKLAKALRGECAYSGCHEPSIDGEHCAPHAERERIRGAKRQQRRRARLRSEKRCLDCAKPIRSRGLRRCPVCRQANAANRRSVTGDVRSVTGDEQIPPRGHFKLAHRTDEGAERGWAPTARYVGRDRRGAPSKDDRDDEVVRDIDYAIAELEKFKKAFALAREHAADLPRVQREEARRLAFSHLKYAGRFVDDAADRE